MRKYLLCLLMVVVLISANAQPMISSFSPTKGPVGTVVTISGSNFSSIAGNNIVYFGAVRASIQSATNTNLMVVVPAGATYEPITVTVNQQIGFSALPFTVTFPGGGATLATGSFAAYERVSSGGTFIVNDVNSDGKADLVRSNNGSFATLVNQSTPGLPLFQPYIHNTPKIRYNSPVAHGDMDGDGKPDLVAVRKDSTAFTVFKNNSTSLQPKWDTGISFRTPPYAYSVAIGDIDRDGRNDVVIGGYDYAGLDTLVVHRNTSTNGVLSFSEALKLPAEFTCVRIADVNSDGKADIIAIPYGSFYFTVFTNTSTPGQVSFTATLFNMNTSSALNAAVCDFDGDGKPDLAVGNYSGSSVTVLKNNSTGASVSFVQAINNAVPSGWRPQFVTAGDIDGDGLPDIITANYAGNSISVIRNTSMGPGSFSFAANIDYPVPFGSDAADVATTDLDGDSKPEVVLHTTYSNNYLNIFRNQIGEPVKVTLCPPAASTSFTSNKTGSSYQWQIDNGNGYTNIAPGTAPFSGSNTATISLSNVPSTWNGYKFRCIVDGGNSQEYVLRFAASYVGPPTGTWTTASHWSCNAVPDAFTDVTVDYGIISVPSDASVRTLRLKDGVRINVATGKTLSVVK